MAWRVARGELAHWLVPGRDGRVGAAREIRLVRLVRLPGGGWDGGDETALQPAQLRPLPHPATDGGDEMALQPAQPTCENADSKAAVRTLPADP
eukprot:COSAG02_NODE_17516_length_998_cov_1.408231_1_plen_94_part_00